ncbi:SLC22A4_5 [Lepeophtheirus salmonis]|uniref:SLC22A4_5 n=1 Tax=Lepeophtheirus salmonis TaxID=72036 RepID=A0A7R8CK99_LEPSM|nr:SLC22A4_5 [Lepeophtheirus salmonis]CAF2801143.1 SLC22A4_5 [Lepeophtheirus salmonis]
MATPDRKLNLEVLLRDVGEFGSFQKRIVTLKILHSMMRLSKVLINSLIQRMIMLVMSTKITPTPVMHMPFIQKRYSNCTRWIYDYSTYGNNFISEFNLVCSQETRGPLLFSSFFAGQMLGVLPIGAFADLFGRKIVFSRQFIKLSNDWICSSSIYI